MPIAPDNHVEDVMHRWPESIRVFLDYRMLCVGCPISRFHTVTDACREHGVDLDCFVADLQTAVLLKKNQGGFKRT